MLTKTEKRFTLIFILLLIFEIITSSYAALEMLHYFAKPALLLSLIIFFCKESAAINKPIKRLTVLALAFSLLGDILLMFVQISPHFFMSGLIAFLIAHVFYVLVFTKQRNPQAKPISFVLALLLYACVLFYFLKPRLGDMLIPVIIYMAVILSMATAAFLRLGFVIKTSFTLVFLGAILFMISDSLLALNKFYKPLPLSNVSIMFTYAFAQLCIVLGLLKQSKKS
ncbi:lysoplasmalogenase [Corallibacter vietnamensis]|uniref:Lysoplasmalogenase n=1 Tax=Corallibacter vietnamensis TaxID=904130 RepID=A0ABP7H6V4_9FLAO